MSDFLRAGYSSGPESPTPGDAATDTPTTDTPGDHPADAPRSLADTRFESCRWHKAAAPPTPAHCSHPEVLPFAGTSGFTADAWCPECQFYKLRRASTRRDYGY